MGGDKEEETEKEAGDTLYLFWNSTLHTIFWQLKFYGLIVVLPYLFWQLLDIVLAI